MKTLNLHPDFREFLFCLLDHKVRFLVAGAYVLAVLGRPRVTDDLDVLVQPTVANAKRLADAWTKRARVRIGDLNPDPAEVQCVQDFASYLDASEDERQVRSKSQAQKKAADVRGGTSAAPSDEGACCGVVGTIPRRVILRRRRRRFLVRSAEARCHREMHS
jgi:hypothetical protein